MPGELDRSRPSSYNAYGYFFKNITDCPANGQKEKPVNAKQETAVPVTAKVKLTLCTDERFFGPGVCELLEGIRETGSIQAAAGRMKMSYSKAWKILKNAEESMETRLITRVAGGKNGGSSTVTAAGSMFTCQSSTSSTKKAWSWPSFCFPV